MAYPRSFWWEAPRRIMSFDGEPFLTHLVGMGLSCRTAAQSHTVTHGYGAGELVPFYGFCRQRSLYSCIATWRLESAASCSCSLMPFVGGGGGWPESKRSSLPDHDPSYIPLFVCSLHPPLSRSRSVGGGHHQLKRGSLIACENKRQFALFVVLQSVLFMYLM